MITVFGFFFQILEQIMMTVLYFLKISKNTNYSDGFILLTISEEGGSVENRHDNLHN